MGWWWTSSSHKDEQQNVTHIEQSNPSSLSSSLSPELSRRPIGREEQADAELQELLAAIEWTGDSEKSKSSTTESLSHNNNPSFPSPTGLASDGGPPKSIAPESLYPDEMSCRSAFDYAFFCQSFGGQWVNVYRYGELRSCSEHWENFWLCMKARGYPDDTRKKMIRDHNRKKAIKYKTGPSSEDVWDVRTEPLTDAFQGDFAAFEKQLKEEQAPTQR